VCRPTTSRIFAASSGSVENFEGPPVRLDVQGCDSSGAQARTRFQADLASTDDARRKWIRRNLRDYVVALYYRAWRTRLRSRSRLARSYIWSLSILIVTWCLKLIDDHQDRSVRGQAVEYHTQLFRQHPDHRIVTSFPGPGEATGARVLAEIGDDRGRFAVARGLKAFAGSAPVTRASGRSICVTHRPVKNNRLAAVGFVWVFATIPRPGPIKDHYDRRRTHGDRQAAALRSVVNRLLGQLYHCLQANQTYDESKAFPGSVRHHPGGCARLSIKDQIRTGARSRRSDRVPRGTRRT